ncbi:crossover junction endonuclease MUS81 [Anopheles ziemanni]|nr:crossover junction endonuclease MUS81 [Anopheles ziemanni]
MPPVKYNIKIVKNVNIESFSTDDARKYRTISARLKRPNPLFEKWLEEMIAKAEEKNSMGKMALQKALTSLRRYPLPLASGRDCIALVDFGKTICEHLEKRLKSYLASGGTVPSNHNVAIEKILNDEESDHYRELTKGLQSAAIEVDSETSEPVEDAMPDDSVFNYVPEAVDGGSDSIAIRNPKAILLVDTAETIGKSKSSLDRTLKELAQNSVEHEVRRLSVGDFVWIVRDDTGRDFLLPYVIERKRMDDLASSIKDGRFHEQKFRLKQCGLANVIYLIEHLGNNRQVGVPESTLTQAALNTYVQDFTVKYTENHHHTVMYLSVMSKFINNSLKNKTFVDVTNRPTSEVPTAFPLSSHAVPLLSFDHFYKQSSKTRDCTVREVFMKQLLQIKLLTIEKVNAIVGKYPTPQSLFRAYERCPSETERQRMLDLPFGPTNRTVGEKLSKVVYHLMMNDRYIS